jgi:hypothetical protein
MTGKFKEPSINRQTGNAGINLQIKAKCEWGTNGSLL